MLQNGGAAKPPLHFTLYLPLLGRAYFGQIFCVKKPSKNQTNEILVRIIAVVLFPSLCYRDQLLQFCTYKFITCFRLYAFSRQNFRSKICSSQKDQLYLKMEGRRRRPSNLKYIYPFQEGHILVECFDLKTLANIKQVKLCMQNCSSWSISHS